MQCKMLIFKKALLHFLMKTPVRLLPSQQRGLEDTSKRCHLHIKKKQAHHLAHENENHKQGPLSLQADEASMV